MKPSHIRLPEGGELRILPLTVAELRVDVRDGKPVLMGLTAPFGKLSQDLGGFQEQIARGAFANALVHSDPVALFNHNPDNLLGRRSAGNLRLEEGHDGLRYEVDLPETEIGNRVKVGVQRGDIQGNSFAFRIMKDQWEERADGSFLRTVLEVEELFDVGPVVYPAYPDTAVAMRSLEAARLTRGPGLRYYERKQRLAEIE